MTQILFLSIFTYFVACCSKQFHILFKTPLLAVKHPNGHGKNNVFFLHEILSTKYETKILFDFFLQIYMN